MIPKSGRFSLRVLFHTGLVALAVSVSFLGLSCWHQGEGSKNPSQGDGTSQTEVKLTTAKIQDLKEAVAANQGKVVFVDVWGEF